MTINLQSLYPYGDLATRSVDHRKNFEWQKPLLGIVTSHYVMDYCESWQSSIIEENKKKSFSLSPHLLVSLSPCVLFRQPLLEKLNFAGH